MPWGKPRSLPIDEFPPEQREQLATAYNEIRSALHLMGELSKVRLPRLTDKAARLAELRRLDATGELYIRITYAGNLNVRALMAPGVAEPDTYAVLLRRPAMKRGEEV